MKILNGKTISKQIISVIKSQVEHLSQVPGLAVILVGSDPASHLYVSLKERACLEAGIKFEKFIFPDSVEEKELIKKIEELNTQKDINGILVQLPLPNQEANKIIAAIDPQKDVDGFSAENLRRLENNQPCLISPVVLGVMKLLEETRESLTDKKAILVMSQIFAQPFVAALNKQKVNSEIVSANDPNLAEITKNGDILITAVGQPNLITGEMLKPEAIVIDIGTTRVGDKVVGDVEVSSTETKTGWLTPVPGGVGPMTVALLLRNVLDALNQHSRPLAKPKN